MSDNQALRIAIVGAGPAGYFAAQALLNQEDKPVLVDMIEKLPTPWGLVRSGVAPDHPKIRTVSKVFEKISEDPRFRLMANVEVGRDLSVAQLREAYDAVVFASGADVGRLLGIPGEDLPGVISAAEFVPWYNAHPDYAEFKVDLTGKRAIVIGAGNVAMDVGRLLAVEPDELASTDISDIALDALRASKITDVVIVARRGPEHAAFTSPELRDLLELEHTNVVVHADDVAAAHTRLESWEEIPKDVRQNMEAFTKLTTEAPTGKERTLEIKFFLAPLEIIGTNHVEAVRFSINVMQGSDVVASGEEVTFPADLVISAVGYSSAGIEGMPLDRGKVRNLDGRVQDEAGIHLPGLYAVGWAKRGPSGVIGTNKNDAAQVMERLLEDLGNGSGVPRSGITPPEGSIDLAGWKLINEREIARGGDARPRVKFPTHSELIQNAR
ncbi:unannotated protein [freshwater metagenome]|uniref:Unannotated protein n=1 Tax=freshwater metagenome TaxID=449393 RepID=A0A6J7BCF3_9ZZZZ|nr:glutamate synthase subunit beta [Actinomycetota bacterium]